MKTIRCTLACLIVAAFAFGCSKDTPPQVPQQGATNTNQQAAKTKDEQAGKVEVTPLAANELKEVVTIPDSVKAKWKAVKITVSNKTDNKTTTLNVPIGNEAAIPGEKINISVKHFVPDFSMDGGKITSASDKLNNPATYIIITEDGVDIYRGWAFTLYPNMNKFEHSKFSITVSAQN